jgi:hypothetical protein
MDDHKKQIIEQLLKTKEDDLNKKYFSIEENYEQIEWFFDWIKNKDFLLDLINLFQLSEIGVEIKFEINVFDIQIEIDIKNKMCYFTIINNKSNLFEDKILKLEIYEDNQWLEKKLKKFTYVSVQT